MPILKVDSGKNSGKVGHYLYFDREGAERAEAFRGSGSAENIKQAEAEFRMVRNQFPKKDGPEFHQIYISFQRSDLGSLANADGTPNWERITKYGEEWARQAGVAERHQFYVVAHGDKPHPHLHIIWNATAFEDGKKYHFYGRKELDRFRDINDGLAHEHGIKRILDRHPDRERAPNEVIRGVEKGGDRYSWKMDLQARIRAASSESLNEDQFRRELKRRRVDVNVRANAYTFSFKDDLDKARKIRGRTLGEEYQRGPLLERFKLHNEMAREPGGAVRFAEKARAEKESLDSWRGDLRKAINDSKRRAPDFEHFKAALKSRGVSTSDVKRSSKDPAQLTGYHTDTSGREAVSPQSNLGAGRYFALDEPFRPETGTVYAAEVTIARDKIFDPAGVLPGSNSERDREVAPRVFADIKVALQDELSREPGLDLDRLAAARSRVIASYGYEGEAGWVKDLRGGNREVVIHDSSKVMLARPPILYGFTDERGRTNQILDRDLGHVYDRGSLDRYFEENAFRRHSVSEIGKAVRQATTPEEFAQRLKERGIELSTVGDRYVYQLPYKAEVRSVEGEQLGFFMRTEAIKNRLMENAVRSEVYSYLKTAIKGARDLDGYDRTLRDHGIEYVPAHDDKAAEVHFEDQAFKASAFGKANPERAEVVIAEKVLVGELRGAIRDAVDAPHYHKLIEERGVTFEPARTSSLDTARKETARVRFRDRTFQAVDLKQWNPELVQGQLDKRDAYQVLISTLKRATNEPEYHKAHEAQGVHWNAAEKDGKTLHFRETNFDPKDVGGLADPAKYEENRAWVRTSRHLVDAMGQAGSPEDFSRLTFERGVTIDERGVSYEGHTFNPKSFGPNNPENVELALAQRTIREHLGESLEAARTQPEYLSELAKRGVTYRPAEGDRAAVVVFKQAEFPAEAFGRLNPEQFTRNLAYKDAHESLALAVVEAKDLPHYETLLQQKGIAYTPQAPDRVGSVSYAGQSFQAPSFYRLDPANAAENLAQRRAYEHLSNSLGRAVSEEHYHELLKEKGILVHRTGDQGQITVRYGGYSFPAAAFGHRSPEHYAENAERAELHGHLQTALAKAPTEAEYHKVLAARGIEYRPAQDLAPASIVYQGRSYGVEGFERVRPDRFPENRAHLDLRTQLGEALKEAKTPAAYHADLAPRGIERIPATPETPAQIRFAGHSFEAAKLGRLDPARSDEAFNHRDAHAIMSAELRAAPRSQDAYLARLEQHGITYRPGSATDAPMITYKAMSYPASSFGWSDPERFPESAARQDLYNTLAVIRRESTDSGDYLARIQAAGIQYHPGGRPYFEHSGHLIEASSLGNVDPDRAQFYQPGSDLARGIGREAKGLVRDLTNEISRASHEGYHDHGGPDYGRQRERSRKRGSGMDSNSTGAESL